MEILAEELDRMEWPAHQLRRHASCACGADLDPSRSGGQVRARLVGTKSAHVDRGLRVERTPAVWPLAHTRETGGVHCRGPGVSGRRVTASVIPGTVEPSVLGVEQSQGYRAAATLLIDYPRWLGQRWLLIMGHPF